jgi:hypothetical protein
LVLSGEHPERGRLHAAVDSGAAYVQGSVCELKFASLLSPYKSIADAEAALVAAGAVLPERSASHG